MEKTKDSPNDISKIGSGGFMNPDKIVEHLDIKNGMFVADFGCGGGYFTIPIARIIQNSGKVYAVDVLSSALELVISKGKLYGLLNIKPVRANIEVVGGTKIENNSVDLVVLANVIFQCNDYDSIFSETKRILKNDGRIVIIDWIPKKVPLGPKFEHCLSEEDIKKLSIKNGFKLIESLNADNSHYCMIFQPI